MDDDGRLTPFAPERLPLEGGPRVEVEVTPAAADHLVAWDVDQRVKAVHEAGHVIAAVVVGIPVKSVDISIRDGGHTEYGTGDDDQPAVMPDSRVLDQMVVALSALAAEKAILGEGTTAGTHDLSQATGLAFNRFDAGLDPDAPFIGMSGVPFSVASPTMADDFYRAALGALAVCRDRAEALVARHEKAIVRFASALYAARRLTGPGLEAAVRDAGLAQARHSGHREPEEPASGG